jgi:predicted nucleic acid-binding Zn finger protein
MTDSYKTFLERASTQRMFVLSRTQGVEENCHAHNENCPIHQIKIAGSTGNVYTVIISHLPTCSCPNTSFKRNDSGQALCKHVLYVLHYVLKVPQHLRYQNVFLTSELKEITKHAPALPTAVVEMEETHDGNRKPVEDDCPICCMEFAKDDDVTWCRAACGNNIHQDCFNLWAKTKAKDNVTCPYCRTLWQDDKPAKSGEQSETLMDVKMTQRTGGYFNVRDQLDYD